MRPESPLRLLFDELLPWRVAAALRILGYDVSWVGHDKTGAPARGASDEEVLQFTTRTSRKIVTSNHDMILLCDEQQQSMIWIDPRGRQFKKEEMAVLAFQSITKWEELLQTKDPVCVRALRTKSEVLPLAEATRFVQQRMRRLRQRKQQREVTSNPAATLFPFDLS